MNTVILKGRLCTEVQLNATDSGKEVARFTVAVPRSYERKVTDFFDVVAWDKTGVFISTYFKKGQEIMLLGEMHRRKWEDKDGNKRYCFELNCTRAEFCGAKELSADEEDVKSVPETDDLPF